MSLEDASVFEGMATAKAVRARTRSGIFMILEGKKLLQKNSCQERILG